MPSYPDTYYAATRTEDRQWARVDGNVDAETCVIGGGLAGVATALALAARGRSVVLLEAERIGWGASGRNGGFASPGYPLAAPTLAERLGETEARALWRMSVEALALVRQRAESFGPSVLQGRSAVRARIVGYPDTLRHYVEIMNDRFEAGLLYLPRGELQALVATDSYIDGYINPSTLHLHPLNFLRAMIAEAEAKGAHVYEGSPAERLGRSGGEWVVIVPGGQVTAQHVVLAGGAYLGLLQPKLGLATVPVASYVATTEPNEKLISTLIQTNAAVSDTRVATDYYRKLPDGRLLWGGRASALQSNPARISHLLHADISRIFPGLGGLRIESAWSGLMAIARHRMPIVGSLAPGCWAAACFGGLGLVTTTLAGELIAAAIADGDDRYRHFAPFGCAFAGGALGKAAFQAIYWRHQLVDRIKRLRHQSSAIDRSAA